MALVGRRSLTMAKSSMATRTRSPLLFSLSDDDLSRRLDDDDDDDVPPLDERDRPRSDLDFDLDLDLDLDRDLVPDLDRGLLIARRFSFNNSMCRFFDFSIMLDKFSWTFSTLIRSQAAPDANSSGELAPFSNKSNRRHNCSPHSGSNSF